MNRPAPTFIDLFCGCGGFSLGMRRAGFRCLAALDFNAEAIATFRRNLPGAGFVEQKDLTTFGPDQLKEQIGDVAVDVIVGGPPCQGFSTARQVDGSNHGARLTADPRRLLYRDFLRYVEYFQPKVFVIENVPGIRTANGGAHFANLHREARELGHERGLPGYRVHSQTEDSFELGVPQKRKRVLVVGVRADIPGFFPTSISPATTARSGTVLWDAIGDLPPLAAGEGEHSRAYESDRREQFLAERGANARNYLHRVLEVDRAKTLTNHVSRPHNERDLRDFARLREGENSATAMRDRDVEFEFPYKKHHFKDRYTRQHRERPCSTIVAHMSKDGLMFIHPTQNRSLTPREAARVQSFPDWFVFPEARTHAFRLIGNAVPPLVGEAVGQAVVLFLNAAVRKSKIRPRPCKPKVDDGALQRLHRIAVFEHKAIQNLASEELLSAWNTLLFLNPDLHPGYAFSSRQKSYNSKNGNTRLNGHAPLFCHKLEISGWPVSFANLIGELRSRVDQGAIPERCLFNEDIQLAGIIDRCGGEFDR